MTQLSSYNDLPYSCHPVRLTHPDNLACKAMLYGLAPKAIEQCRVLEIGCGNDTNLFTGTNAEEAGADECASVEKK